MTNTINTIVPLSVTQEEQIFELRDWANVRAVSATPIDEQYDNEIQDDVNAFRGGRSLDF